MNIDKDKYLSYLNNNKNITGCQKKMLINYYENLNSINTQTYFDI